MANRWLTSASIFSDASWWSHGRLYHFFFLQPADSGAHAERPADLCYSEHGSLTPPLLAGRGVGFQGSQSVVPAGVITPWNTTQGTPGRVALRGCA